MGVCATVFSSGMENDKEYANKMDGMDAFYATEKSAKKCAWL